MYLGILRTPLVALLKCHFQLCATMHHFQIVKKQNFCGASRDRTDDLLVANQALSQLSYSPELGP